MSRWLEIFKNGRVYEIENDQAVKLLKHMGK
jgi:hypothetical protein